MWCPEPTAASRQAASHPVPVREGPTAKSPPCAVRLHRPQEIDRIYPKNHPMDWRKLQAFVVDIDQLGQGVARRVIHYLALVLRLRLEPLPDGARRGEGVVAVAHRVDQRRLAAREAGDMPSDLVDQRPIVDVPTSKPATPQHQLEIVGQFQVFCAKRLNHRLLRIVDQHHNVRGFQQRFLPHLDPRRQPTLIRTLGRANQLLRSVSVVVLLQVQGNDQSLARRSAPYLPLYQHKPGPLFRQYAAFEIRLHPLVNAGNGLFAASLPKVCFGKN